MGGGLSKTIREDGSDRVLVAGRPDLNRCDNMITTSKYTPASFLPLVRRFVPVLENCENTMDGKSWGKAQLGVLPAANFPLP